MTKIPPQVSEGEHQSQRTDDGWSFKEANATWAAAEQRAKAPDRNTIPDGMTQQQFERQRNALDSKGHFFEPVRSDTETAVLIGEMARLEEAKAKQEEQKTERERLRQVGVPIPPPSDPSGIVLEWAMPKHIDTLKLEYLVDPFLPAKCVVGFYGRGSSAKSSFLATMAAQISDDWSTLWITVEERTDWVTQRHIHSGGEQGTLAAFTYTATKRDAQGRVVGSTFNTYQDLESSIIAAKAGAAMMHNPPRPLRLVVLDTAVGLTTWSKGESPNNDADVKRLMAYLQAVAEIYDVTIAVIGHTNKGKHDHFADMVAGAGAWTTSPRLSFIHTRDRREEYSYVMRVAKSNLTSSFAVAYKTKAVLTLHQHKDGHEDVLCKIIADPVVWGEEASMELFEAATRKPDEGDGFEDRRPRTPTAVENAVQAIVETLMTTPDTPLTRSDVEQKLEQSGKSKPDRHRWLQVDAHLAGHPTVEKFNDPGRQNLIVYRRKT